MSEKTAATDHPINELLAKRWSPYGFKDQQVAPADVRSLLEAARWAPSSYNEQPWSFFIATKDEPGEFERLLSCLVEANQAWAKAAPAIRRRIAPRFTTWASPLRISSSKPPREDCVSIR